MKTRNAHAKGSEAELTPMSPRKQSEAPHSPANNHKTAEAPDVREIPLLLLGTAEVGFSTRVEVAPLRTPKSQPATPFACLQKLEVTPSATRIPPLNAAGLSMTDGKGVSPTPADMSPYATLSNKRELPVESDAGKPASPAPTSKRSRFSNHHEPKSPTPKPRSQRKTASSHSKKPKTSLEATEEWSVNGRRLIRLLSDDEAQGPGQEASRLDCHQLGN